MPKPSGRATTKSTGVTASSPVDSKAETSSSVAGARSCGRRAGPPALRSTTTPVSTGSAGAIMFAGNGSTRPSSTSTSVGAPAGAPGSATTSSGRHSTSSTATARGQRRCM